MRWSLRTTHLAIVLPLTLATLGLAGASILDSIAVREDAARLRDGAFRSIYAERYARDLQVLLKESFDYIEGRRPGPEQVTAARAQMAETLERLRPYVHESRRDGRAASEFTAETFREWEESQEQVDAYLTRAIDHAQMGEDERARALVMDELDVLLNGRIFSALDAMIQRERELLEESRIRVMRATERRLVRHISAPDLHERVLPDVYEAILAERFARVALAELGAFSHHLLADQPLGADHGMPARQAGARLAMLQRKRAGENGPAAGHDAREPGKTYALVRDAYARTLELPLSERRQSSLAVLQWLDDVFERSILPNIDVIVQESEESIDAQMARLDEFAASVMSLTMGIMAAALLLGFGTPFLVTHRMVRPIEDLVDTLTSFRSGDKEARPRMRPHNELGILSRSLGALLDELQEADRRVRTLACYDTTTGLPNREFFHERLAGALTTARHQKRAMGLLSINLSGFKQINETLGHSAGDELVQQVAARLRECVRMSDIVSRPSEDGSPTELSRIECDEFSILLTKVSQASDAAIVAQRLLTKLGAPFVVNGRDILVNVSVGIGVYPQDGGDAEALVRSASAAMNHAMRRGGNDYQFYSEAMNTANSRKLHIQSRLSGAIERTDFALHFQPVRNAKDGRLVGAEALLRWRDPEMGPIGPDEFIPIAEQAGLISQIGRWVLDRACAQARAWQDAGFADLRMSVNVSACELRDERWVESVAETLQGHGLSPGLLELEITETTILREDAKTFDSLNRLSEMGVGIALDDFGTGYSSLSHLRRLPIRRVKIDRSFVSEITDEGQGAALAAAVVKLAHSLDLGVVAEGVETEEQAGFLRDNGCDELQGYLISRPVPPVEFERFLEGSKPD